MKTLALTVGLLAFGCSGEADIGATVKHVTLCDSSSCTDPAPLSPIFQCPDGTIAGPTCADDGDGCGWQVIECDPDPMTCTIEACGPAPANPIGTYTCDDGTIAGLSCGMTDHGCGWTIVQCPQPMMCDPADCMGSPSDAPNFICKDGSIGGPACRPAPVGGCAWTIVQCPM